MEQKQIDRINELAKKAKSPEGLTEWEEMERAALRREYIDSVLGSLKGQLDNTYIVQLPVQAAQYGVDVFPQPERAAGQYLYCGCQGQQNKAEEKG